MIFGSSVSRIRTLASRRLRLSLRFATVWNSCWTCSGWPSGGRTGLQGLVVKVEGVWSKTKFSLRKHFFKATPCDQELFLKDLHELEMLFYEKIFCLCTLRRRIPDRRWNIWNRLVIQQLKHLSKYKLWINVTFPITDQRAERTHIHIHHYYRSISLLQRTKYDTRQSRGNRPKP